MDILRNIPRKKIIIVVFFIILLQLCVCTYFFAFEKKGYYADDLYSYGYANSSGKVSPLEDENTVIQADVWLDSKILNDYLTVSTDEFFSYDKIYLTLKRDAHPPLFYMILHFICSFTPDFFTKWSAYIINIVGLLILQIYLYRLSLFISKNRFISLLIMSFFGFTSATINMMCLLRMYIIATGFITAFTFYAWNYLFISSVKKPINKDLVLSAVFLFLSAMTVYITILYAFFLTFFICAIFLFRKEFKQLFSFGFSMFFSVILMVLCFPVFFDQLSLDQPAMRGAELYPYMLQLRTGIQIILNPLFGLTISIFPTMTATYFGFVLIALIIIYLLLLFIFRNDNWFHTLNNKARSTLLTLIKKSKSYVYTLLPIFISCLAIILISARRLLLYYYHFESIRYMYPLLPFLTIAVLLPAFKIVRKNTVQTGLCLLVIFTSILLGDKCYLLNEGANLDVREITKDADVILVENGNTAFIYHIAELLDSHSFIDTTPKSISDNTINTSLLEHVNDNKTILMVNVDAVSLQFKKIVQVNPISGVQRTSSSPDNEMEEYFRTDLGFNDIEYLGRTRISYVYRLK